MTFKAEDLIKQSIKKYGEQIAVACSFGKDSIVILHMAIKYNPNIKVMFNNTNVEFPETIKYKKMIVKKWKLNLIETKPIKTFWQCIEEYGVPEVRNRGKNRTPKCCYYCKEKPALDSCKKNKIIAILTGLMACESSNRRLLMIRYENSRESKDKIGFCGQRYFAKTQGLWKIHPIAYWSEQDVWNYIKKHNIPINPVYTKWNGIYRRCGCLPCTAYLDWEKKLPKTHPKLYLQLKKLQNPTQEVLTKHYPV